jgi:hypothetical protein
MEDFQHLLDRAGLQPAEEDKQHLKPLFDKYMERLKLLHSADLDDEEVASVFSPQWRSEVKQLVRIGVVRFPVGDPRVRMCFG